MSEDDQGRGAAGGHDSEAMPEVDHDKVTIGQQIAIQM